jgi:predicted nucleic acid-binding protein
MRLLFDTNVLLDLLLDRESHADVAEQLVAAADSGVLDGVLCADALTTVDHVVAKALGPARSRRLLGDLLRIFAIVPVDRAVLESALRLDFPDFEDAVVHEAARASGAAGIVTRDTEGFSRGTVPALDPLELLSTLAVAYD